MMLSVVCKRKPASAVTGPPGRVPCVGWAQGSVVVGGILSGKSSLNPSLGSFNPSFNPSPGCWEWR